MDSQRSLFKKFFGTNNGNKEHNSPNEGSGFNPPKFQFNKKKLGNARISGTSDKSDNLIVAAEDKVMKEIESTAIDDSELGDHLDDWNDTTMNTTKIVANETDYPVKTAPPEPSIYPTENLLHKSILQKKPSKI